MQGIASGSHGPSQVPASSLNLFAHIRKVEMSQFRCFDVLSSILSSQLMMFIILVKISEHASLLIQIIESSD